MTPPPGRSIDPSRTYARVTARLIPLLLVSYVVAYLDRVNVGFAKLQMLADLQMSDTAYGLGAGLFFIGYFLFEVPSNLILHRVGARVWIARIMITWGLLSAATMFVRSVPAFYVLRLVLGVAEAGFFPGIVYYLSQWYPTAMRARIVALFMTAVAVSGVFGGPVSGWILGALHGVRGLAGWQWLFLLEGLPSVLLGILILVRLDDGIASAAWLTADERAFLQREVEHDDRGRAEHGSVWITIRDPRVLLLSAVYFCFVIGLYGIGFWLPQLIRNLGVAAPLQVGLLSAIPYGVAAIAMVRVARSSDQRGERRRHLIATAITGAVGLTGAGLFAHSVTGGMVALTIATAGILSVLPLCWTLPSAFLRGATAAAGIAVINSVGNLAGFLSPYMIGAISDATGTPTMGLYAMAAFMLLGAALVIPATRGVVVRGPLPA